MPDAKSLKQLLVGHIHTFKMPIESITADRGYYAKANEQMGEPVKEKHCFSRANTSAWLLITRLLAWALLRWVK